MGESGYSQKEHGQLGTARLWQKLQTWLVKLDPFVNDERVQTTNKRDDYVADWVEKEAQVEANRCEIVEVDEVGCEEACRCYETDKRIGAKDFIKSCVELHHGKDN